MTLQEFFNDTYQAFVIEKAPPSYQAYEQPVYGEKCKPWGCMYRGPNGERCAVGRFIPDEKYKREMEMNNVAAIVRDYPGAVPALEGIDVNPLLGVQDCHDVAAQNAVEYPERDFHDLVKANLEDFAKEQGLTIPGAV
jgi:hypothetical protein